MNHRLPWLRVISLTALLCLAALPGATPYAAAQEAAPASPQPFALSDEPLIEYAPATVLVKVSGVALQGGVNATSGEAAVTVAGNAPTLAGSLLAFGATAAEPIFAQSQVSAAGVAETTYRVTLRADADVPMAAQAMAIDPAVVWAEPDYIARPAAPLTLTPNDPDLAQQWALAKIGAPAAWDLSTGSPDVIIAFIDSGIDTAHEEFAGRLWVNDDPAGGGDNDSNGYADDINGWNFVTKSANIADSSGHGTQVAGVAGAASNNGKGIAGLCWQCRLMIVTAMQPSGAANYSDIAEAVKYASSNGAQVINISLGGYADSQVLRDAITEASVTALVVAGAGNDDSASPFYPAAYTQVMAVAATDADDKKPVFSNYGQWVDVSAPGVNIRTPTLGNNDYVSDNGTSLSTAFVSGLAGLLKSRNPGWTPEQVRWQIVNTAAPIGPANPTYVGQLGAGRINAQAALATTPTPRLALEGFAVDGVAAARPAPGQSFQLVATLRNTWLPASDLNATLTSADPYVQITDAAGSFGALPSGQSASNSGNPFGVTLAGNTPYSRNLAFTLNLSGSGGFAASVPLVVQVRSSIVTLGNTQYSQDTTWTNDHTYVLDGSVIVAEGVKLTIQPGTVIKVAPDKFIRIDGTLIADGTAEQPIVFTWKTEGQAPWGGIRFTATSVGASTAEDVVVGQNVFRGIELSHADNAVTFDTAEVSQISQLRCSDNSGDCIRILGSSSPSIIDSQFERNKIGVHSDGNSQMIIQGSVFVENETGVEGSFAEVSETKFFSSSGAAIRSCNVQNAQIRDNVIVENGRALVVGAAGIVSITHNLFSNNSSSTASECDPDYRESTIALGSVQDGSIVNVSNNTIVAAGSVAISLKYIGADTQLALHRNNFLGTSEIVLRSDPGSGGAIFDATSNFWNTPPDQIPNRIDDCTFDGVGCGAAANRGKVLWDPPLATPDQTAPAFVTSVFMSPNPVGLQRGTLTVNFSRPMRTDVSPNVTFISDQTGKVEVRNVPILTDYWRSGARDALGRVWIGMDSGAAMYDGVSWTKYTTANSGLATNAVVAIFSAANGDVWFGHSGEVLFSRLRGTQWSHVTAAQIQGLGVDFSVIRVIREDIAGTIWAGAEASGKVIRIQESAAAALDVPGVPAGWFADSIAPDGLGRIWFATKGTSIQVYDHGVWSQIATIDGMATSSLYGIWADSQHRIILNGSGGRVTNAFTMVNGVPTIVLELDSSISEAPDGSVWTVIGPMIYSMYRLANGKWEKYEDIDYLPRFLYNSDGKRSLRGFVAAQQFEPGERVACG